MKIKCKECGRGFEHEKHLLCPHCSRLPIEQNLWKSIDQILPLLVQLNNKINNLKKFCKKQKLSLNDQRTQTIGTIAYITIWAIFQLKLFVPNFKTKNSLIPIYMKSLNPGMSDEDMVDLIYNCDLMNRVNFFTMFLFQIDVLLRCINSTITKNKVNGYKQLVKQVLKDLKIPNKNNEKYHVLYIPAMVRNCLHTSGIHMEENDNGKIDEYLFKFETGKASEYGSWLHEYFFCNKIIDVIEEILNLPKIKKIKLLKL